MRQRRLAFAGIAVAYALLCLGTATVWELAHDEGVTWEQAVGPLPIPSFPQSARPIADFDAWLDGARPFDARAIVARLGDEGGMHPPLYYLGFALWLRSVGADRWALTLAPLALGLVLLGTLQALARRMASAPEPARERIDPLWAVALLASSPWWIGFTVFARPYAWLVVVSGLATWAALRTAEALPGGAARPEPRSADWRWPALFVACSLAGLYSLYHYAFVVLWHATMLGAVALRRPRALRGQALAQVLALGFAIALAFAPWIPMLLHHIDETNARPWYFSQGVPVQQWPLDALRTLRFFALGAAERAPALGAAAGVLGAASAGALAFGAWRGRRGSNAPIEVRALWLAALVMPIGIAASDLSRATHTFFFSKLHFAWALLFPLLIVRAAGQLPGRAAGRALLCAWIALQLAACAWMVGDLRGTSRVEQLAAEVARDDRSSQRVVISTRLHGYSQSLLHALRDAGVRDARIVHVPGPLLAEYLSAAVREPGVEKISLVNLAAFYQPGAMWNASAVQGALNAARRAGWKTVAHERLADTPGPALGYSVPLQVRYFSK